MQRSTALRAGLVGGGFLVAILMSLPSLLPPKPDAAPVPAPPPPNTIPQDPWRLALQRPPLAYCRIDGRNIPARKPPRTGTADLGDGITVHYGERRTARPQGFHIVYRSDSGLFDLYGDGTVDAHVSLGQVDLGIMRFYIPRTEMSALADTLRRLDIRHQPEARQIIADGYVANADVTMDGWRVRNRHLTHDMSVAINRAVRDETLRQNPLLRAAVLEANGFRLDSATGADVALVLAMNRSTSDTDLKTFLTTYRVPCVGGMYGVAAAPIFETPRRWRLRDALIEGKHPAVAALVDPAPGFPPIPPSEMEAIRVSQPFPAADWLAVPDAIAQPADYPPKAWDDDVQGQADISCVFTTKGGLSDCEVRQEYPKGYGFGAATIKLLTQKAVARPGHFQAGRHVLIRWRWVFAG